MPANKPGMAEKLVLGKIRGFTSAALCLEDSIADDGLSQAENELKHTLEDVLRLAEKTGRELPLLFVRPRTPEHLEHIHAFLGDAAMALTGYILPKFDLTNADRYCEIIPKLPGKHFYCMPILESRQIADIATRQQSLYAIREKLDAIGDHVLNVRVGGNDFSNLYGIRRGVGQSIWQAGLVRDIFVDILNVFSMDYVVSGPVWEYFGDDEAAPWAEGLRAELEMDMLNGFVGKTAIHPAQLPVINRALQVHPADLSDARQILGWTDKSLAVGHGEGRMNEVKCHSCWAKRIVALAEIYGVKE